MRVFLLLALVAFPAGAQQSLRWSHYDVEAFLDAGGVLHMTETLHYVFDGPWNGGERVFHTRPSERVELESIERIAPAGRAVTLRRDGDLDEIDEYDWHDSRTLRWRSRLPDDPPFAGTPITYRLRYTLHGALRPRDGEYLLDLDLAPTDLAGPIERFTWRVELDPAWTPLDEVVLSGERAPLPPGDPVDLVLPLEYAGAGVPPGVPEPMGPAAAIAIGALFLAIVGFELRAFSRGEKAKGRFDPMPPLDRIDRAWLDEHVFRHPPEVIGAAWDEQTGSAEVAAVLARMVQEGKLESRIEGEAGFFSKPVLHLRLLVPRESLPDYERPLINAMFFGGDETDTTKIRERYRKKGFDPASRIRPRLNVFVDRLVGTDRAPSGWNWKIGVGLLLAGVLALVTGGLIGTPADLVMAAAGAGIAFVPFIIGAAAAGVFQSRVGSYGGPAFGIGLAIALMGLGLGVAMLIASRVPIEPVTVAGLALLAGAFTDVIFGTARMRLSRERMQLRRNLLLARNWFEAELRTPAPRLEDAWFPYLLAFGLGAHIDQWFRAFGTVLAGSTLHDHGSGVAARADGSSWSGGGGAFGGAGASGSWGVAAAALGAGVAAPSSSGGGGGGGGGSSGGGGAGGW